MTPNADTTVLARLHPERNGRGLNVYNPYFEGVGLNVIYTLFHNPDPAPLLAGVRSLGIAGAVVAGSFEKDERLPALLDEVHPISQRLGTVGVVANRGGRLVGLYQGGYGLYDSIVSTFGQLAGRTVTLVGAGNVARALLLVLEESGDLPGSLTIYNRDIRRAERLAADFSFVTDVGDVPTFLKAGAGDVLINATKVGSASCREPDFDYSTEQIERFDDVADVAFLPLDPPLVQIARSLGKRVAPGYRMFMLQARCVLHFVLDHEMDQPLYEGIMLTDFRENW